MGGVRAQGERIRRYLLLSVEKGQVDTVASAVAKFGISRQAINKHLRRMVEEGSLTKSGTTRNTKYRLAPLAEFSASYPIDSSIAEDLVWRRDAKATIGSLPANVISIWQYGFTEIFNNAIDHSEGALISVRIRKTATTTEMMISDDGVGIFKKIQSSLGLLDERHAVLELAKGKLTTDPKRHTGEGIFFSSRMFDSFDILAGGVYFTHSFGDEEDWILESPSDTGTYVWMKLNNHTSRTVKKVFDRYAGPDDYGFTKTVVPVKLAQYGDDKLISRSQAKRLLNRVELFKTVLFDFTDVEEIGQAFADEIFRVFANEHPAMELTPIRTNALVQKLIDRAKASEMGS